MTAPQAVGPRDAPSPLQLDAYLHGDSGDRTGFTRELLARLHRVGFTYLTVPSVSPQPLYHPRMFGETYCGLFTEALTESPFLERYLGAASVFEDGYNRGWFPESVRIHQPIEALMMKPTTWRRLRRKRLPPRIRACIDGMEKLYTLIHNLADTLLAAIEAAYGVPTGELAKMFRRRADGAVRFVKYHRPNRVTGSGPLATRPSEPHVDKSFFSFNLGETRSGLVWVEDDHEWLLPNRSDCLLVTSGRFSAGLTRHSANAISSFHHTVWNDGDRVVGLAFVAPEGRVHDLPMIEWPRIG